MSQYLNEEQQERLTRIVDEFTVHSGVKQAGLTIKTESNIVFRQLVEKVQKELLPLLIYMMGEMGVDWNNFIDTKSVFEPRASGGNWEPLH